MTLQPGVANRLTYAPDPAFGVKFTNQGENDEFDIKVTLRIEGGAASRSRRYQDGPADRRRARRRPRAQLDQHAADRHAR